MASLLDFKTPTGQTGNILKPGTWVPMIWGAMVLILTFAMGQSLLRKVPFPRFVDTQPEPVFVQEPKQKFKRYAK